MKLVDAGSTWCKIFAEGDEAVAIGRTKDLLLPKDRFDFGTGHAARHRCGQFENDLLALARGALAVVDEPDFTVLDVGSRDSKFVTFRDRRPARLDWSVGCSTATGATIEMLGVFYGIDFDELPGEEAAVPVTCGVFALERIMDLVARGEPPARGVAGLVHGVARQQWRFAGKPEKIYLSGGFCHNRSFVAYLRRYAEVRPLGRTVPLVGLWAWGREQGLITSQVIPPSLQVVHSLL